MKKEIEGDNPTLARLHQTMINPFGKISCPKGGWRKHCGQNCLYKHYDDPEDRSQLLGAKQTDAIARAISGKSCHKAQPMSPLKKVQQALDESVVVNGYHITGMKNIDGTSCYINSAIQSLISLKPFRNEMLQSQPCESKSLTRELWKTIQQLVSVMNQQDTISS